MTTRTHHFAQTINWVAFLWTSILFGGCVAIQTRTAFEPQNARFNAADSIVAMMRNGDICGFSDARFNDSAQVVSGVCTRISASMIESQPKMDTLHYADVERFEARTTKYDATPAGKLLIVIGIIAGAFVGAVAVSLSDMRLFH